MTDGVGTSIEDLERYLREHHLRGAGIQRAGDPPPPREGYAAGFWKWAELYPALEQAGNIIDGVEVFPWSAGPGDIIGVDDPIDGVSRCSGIGRLAERSG